MTSHMKAPVAANALTWHPNSCSSSPSIGGRCSASGFTLLELLVVLVVLGFIAAIVSPQVMSVLSGAKSSSAALQIDTLSTALNYYQLDTGTYPSTEQGLEALITAPKEVKNWRGPYVRKQKYLIDPWGRLYRYRAPGKQGPFDVFSFGSDGKEGGEGDNADVGTWDVR